MNAEEVVRYLREHPGFLGEHVDLLSVLTVPHPRHGKAISLTERQLHDLRGKIRQLEQKLAELLQFGERNDVISEKVHRLSVSLLEADSYDSARRALFDSIQNDLSVPHVALRVWEDAPLERDGEEFSPVGEGVRQFADEMTRPSCGAPSNSETLSWFGEMAPHIRSMASMSLRRNGKATGLLVLGSEEVGRFYNDMGTLYLERIAAMASAALLGGAARS
ncbi:MAG: DUF484 family protein [Azoarcus sp.]|jgi:uncharacterized protein YigA (DUF484 family)|nr:DUF484 family protein [Azoarcus sp.]